MKPLSLHIELFGSFVKPTTFTFPTEPGLYFMTGRNEAEPELERNGAGKTTIWKALTWCLFGKDVRGLSAGAVANWNESKGASVIFGFNAEDDYLLTRMHSPNKWLLHNVTTGELHDLTKDDTNPLHDMLRLNFDEWLATVVLAQGEPMFLDLKPAAKAALFSTVMNLEKWERFSRKAGERTAEQTGVVAHLFNEGERLRAEIKGLDAIDLRAEEKAWNTRNMEALAEVERLYRAGIKTAERAKKAAEDAEVETDACRVELRARTEQYAAEDERTKHAAKCPTCGAPQRKASETLAEALDRLTKARTRMEVSERTSRSLRIAYEAAERELDRLDEEAEKIDGATNPYFKAMATTAGLRAGLRDKYRQVLQRLVEATERGEKLGFWVRGFRDIRLLLIGEALEHLSVEVNGCLEQYGLVGWELRFEVDRETAAGGVARGFNVFVKGPGNPKQVPWESWSGGEAQRLRIATQQGLANLIRSSTGAELALEVWDEPSQGMSAQGVLDLLTALRSRAQQEQRVIYVVDHHALGHAAFDGFVTIVKDADGSRVES